MFVKGLVAACAALMLIVGILWIQKSWQASEIDLLTAENASLSRSIATLELSREQAREAQSVAEANAERERSVSAEYEKLRDDLRNGKDEELPCWFIDAVNDILGRVSECGD